MYRACNWDAERRKWPAWDNTHEMEWLDCKSVPSGSVLYSQPPLSLDMCTQEDTHTHTHLCTAQNTSCGSLISYRDDDQLDFCSLKPVCEVRILHLLSVTLGKSLNLSETQSSNCAVGIFTELMPGYLGRAQHGAWTCKHLDKFSHRLYYSVHWLLCGVWFFVTPMDRSMGLSRQESWSGCHFLLQGIVSTQGLNLGVLQCKQMLDCLSYQGSPIIIINNYYL